MNSQFVSTWALILAAFFVIPDPDPAFAGSPPAGKTSASGEAGSGFSTVYTSYSLWAWVKPNSVGLKSNFVATHPSLINWEGQTVVEWFPGVDLFTTTAGSEWNISYNEPPINAGDGTKAGNDYRLECAHPSDNTRYRQMVRDSTRAHGAKMILCLGGAGSTPDAKLTTILADSVTAQRFADSVLVYLKLREYDGCSLNWEHPSSVQDGLNQSRLFRMLRRGLDTWSPKGYLANWVTKQWSSAYDARGMNENCDIILPRFYNMNNEPNKPAGHMSALYAEDCSPSMSSGNWNLDALLKTWFDAGFDTAKLAMMTSGEMNIDFNYSYPELCQSRGNTKGGFNTYSNAVVRETQYPGEVRWSEASRVPYMLSGGAFYTYDNPRSIQEKIDYARSKGLTKLAMWDVARGLVHDPPPGHSYQELLDVIIANASGGSEPPPPPPPPPADTVPPAVVLLSPSEGDTVEGSVILSARATDNTGVIGVRFLVDGDSVGSWDAFEPYELSWNTVSAENGTHAISVVARDAAGLSATASVTVRVFNDTAAGPPPDPPANTLTLFDESLASPWIDASWGAVNAFSNTNRVYRGSYALRTEQDGWGAVSLRSGNWSQPVDLDLSGYTHLTFAVNPEGAALSLNFLFSNDGGETFPDVRRRDIPADTWTVISIPLEELNPGHRIVHRLTIQNASNSSSTYFIDALEFTPDSSLTGTISAPSLLEPADGAVDQGLTPVLSWTEDPLAIAYHLQVATDTMFTQIVVDDSTLTGNTYPLDSLSSHSRYYWRVRAISVLGTGPYSPSFSFTTLQSSVTLKYDRLFVDFGLVAIGDEKLDSVSINNGGDSPAEIREVVTSSPDFSAVLEGSTVPPGSFRRLYVKFKPENRGTKSELVIALAYPSGELDTMHVTGRGGKKEQNRRSRNAIVFNQVLAGSESSDSFYVSNDGDFALTLNSVTTTHAAFSVSPGSAVIPPEDSVVFHLSVSSTQEGSLSGYVVFSENGTAGPDSMRVEAVVSNPASAAGIPGEYALLQNYPNPFNPSTTIGYNLPARSRVRIQIFNVFGQEVRSLVDREEDAGARFVEWNGMSGSGDVLPSGVYYYRLQTSGLESAEEVFVATRRMMLVK